VTGRAPDGRGRFFVSTNEDPVGRIPGGATYILPVTEASADSASFAATA
jgi:hypothetical protein